MCYPRNPVLLGGPENQILALWLMLIRSSIRRNRVDHSQALLVFKDARQRSCQDIRQYDITDHGFEVQSNLKVVRGILSGSPRRLADLFCRSLCKTLG